MRCRLYRLTHLYLRLMGVLDLVDNNETALISRFWESQLADFEVLPGKALTLPKHRYKQTHPGIAPDTGRAYADLSEALTQSLQSGDQRRASQFCTDPLTGYICQSGVFPSQLEPIAELTGHSFLFPDASQRFQQRGK